MFIECLQNSVKNRYLRKYGWYRGLFVPCRMIFYEGFFNAYKRDKSNTIARNFAKYLMNCGQYNTQSVQMNIRFQICVCVCVIITNLKCAINNMEMR